MTANTDLTYRRYENKDMTFDDWTEQIFQASWTHKCPTYVHRTPPCQGSCPSGHDIRGWLAIARGQDKSPDGKPWQEYAFNRMTESNPFPATMGRVCPAPCEDGCNRNMVEDFVGINAVEQYVGDWAIEHNLKLPEPAADTGKKVAIVGGGPAGLAAAYNLRQKGHAVTLFEANDSLGGMMRYGIPGYRTPREMLDAEIGRIIDQGVDVKLNTKIGKDISFDDLKAGYDAIFWAMGAQSGRPLPIPGADAPNCISGVAFLKAFNEGRLQHVQGPIVVVGGGDTSIDVASVARRLGNISEHNKKDRVENVVMGFVAHDVATSMARQHVDVVLTSLFPVKDMMAAEREVNDAVAEGVDIQGGVMPLEVILGDDGNAKAIKMCKCTMEGSRPVAVEGSEYFIDCDLVVSAIGQSGELEGLSEIENEHGFVNVDGLFQVKDQEGQFAGGDVLRPHLLTTAIGHASIAAEGIDQYLSGKDLSNAKRPKVDKHHFNLLGELLQRDLSPVSSDKTPTRGTDDENFAVHNYEDRSAIEIVKHDQLFLGHFQHEERNKRKEIHIDADDVLSNFKERIVNLTEDEIVNEAGRCMSCGMCFECDNCVIYCPQDAVHRVKKDQRALGRYVDTDYNKCIGCHVCMDVCPTGYIQMGLGE